MNKLKTFLLLPFVLVLSLSAAIADPLGSEPIKHTVIADGHPMALWEKSVENPRGHIILHHGRTWSSLPDFDLQVAGEKLSLMDGFREMGYSVWALDARGYGETSRDDSGWNTPDRAAKDLSIVLEWLYKRNGEKTHVWGWSLGSMVAQLSAQKTPKLVSSLTLFGYPLRSLTGYPKVDSPAAPPRKANTAKNAASDFIVENTISKKAIDEYVRHSLAADPIRADWKRLDQWSKLDASKVRVPVLLMHGEFDPLARPEIHSNVFVQFPNANKQWVVLAGGDHAALLETTRNRLIASTIDFIEWLEK